MQTLKHHRAAKIFNAICTKEPSIK